MTEKYMKHIDECGMYYYICNGEEIIAEAFYGDDAQDIVDLLNKQEEQIKELEKENKKIKQKITEKTKVSVTLSENFDNIMILMNASFSKDIKENEHFFEEIGQKLDLQFKDGDVE